MVSSSIKKGKVGHVDYIKSQVRNGCAATVKHPQLWYPYKLLGKVGLMADRHQKFYLDVADCVEYASSYGSFRGFFI